MDDDFIHDLFASVGPIRIRRMFGGRGIYCEAGIFALEAFDRLFVKGDDQSAPIYEKAGMARWLYENPKTGKRSAMPYWQVPDDALDDADAMAPWAYLGVQTAIRAAKA